MKKILFSAFALLFSVSAMALDNEPQEGVTTVAFMGMNATRINNTFYTGKVGGVAGVKFDYILPSAHGTYITAGLDWSLKGGKMKDVYTLGDDDILRSDVTIKNRLHYFEIPVRAGFRYNLNKEFGFYGEFGPYFAVGVGGKHREKFSAEGSKWDQAEIDAKYPIFKDVSTRENYQRWDCGLGFRIGAEYNQHYNVMLGCDWGITDMYRQSYRTYCADRAEAFWGLSKARNFNFTLSLGYRF